MCVKQRPWQGLYTDGITTLDYERRKSQSHPRRGPGRQTTLSDPGATTKITPTPRPTPSSTRSSTSSARPGTCSLTSPFVPTVLSTKPPPHFCLARTTRQNHLEHHLRKSHADHSVDNSDVPLRRACAHRAPTKHAPTSSSSSPTISALTPWAATATPDVTTPNLDRLADEGIVFDNHYDTTAICMASRASILTGKLEYRHGCNFEHGNLVKEALAEGPTQSSSEKPAT